MSRARRTERRGQAGPGAPAVGDCPGVVLPPNFYARPATEVARDLLGMRLVSTVGGAQVVGRIVETEAYTGPEDAASHASERIGRTIRNEAMFGPPGRAYVYLIYGMHWCLNAVTGDVGHPAAVLIRAAEVVTGAEVARGRRGEITADRLMRGPGNLCKALGITGEFNTHTLTQEPVTILSDVPIPDANVSRGARVGISRAVDLPLRFWVRDHPAVSAR